MTLEEIRARTKACNTSDGIDHDKKHVEDCLDALIEKYEDGYVNCVLNWSGRTCEECMELFEARLERDEA